MAHTNPATKREMKRLTFGARGFVLESAMIDDEEMRVIRRERAGQREFSVACYQLEDNRRQDTRHP